MNIVHMLIGAADVATREPLKQLLARHLEVDGEINLLVDSLQSLVKGLRLSDRPWKAIEKDALRSGQVADGVEYHRDGHLVGNKLPLVHKGFRLQPQFGLLAYLLAE